MRRFIKYAPLFCLAIFFPACAPPDSYNPGNPGTEEFYFQNILGCALGAGTGCSGPTIPGPDSISNLTLWLEADSFSLTEGASIDAWPDKSGNGNAPIQTTSPQQPVFKSGVINGRAAVRFDPVATQHLTMGANYLYSSNDGLTIMAVIRNNSQNAGQYILDFGGNSQAGYGLGFSANTNGVGTNALFYTPTTGSVGGLQQFVVRQTQDTEWVVILGRIKFAPASDKHQSLFLNGTSFYTETAINVTQLTANEICEATTRGGTGAATPIAACSSTGNGGPVTIGAQSRTISDSTRFFDGDIALVVLYDRALTDAERETLECYGSRTYGIVIDHACN